MTDNEIRLAFADAAVRIITSRPETAVDGALTATETIFRRAGLVLDTFSPEPEPTFEKRGLPPKGAWVILKQQWERDPHGRPGQWQPTDSWNDATRRAQVRSKKAIKGRRGVDGQPLDAFTVRGELNGYSGALDYAGTRLYVHEENITWRWGD